MCRHPIASSRQILTLNIKIYGIIYRGRTILTRLFGNPGSNGAACSIRRTCSGVKEMSSAVMFSLSCSTFLPPMIGKHVGELMQMVRNSNYKCSSNLGYRRKLQRAKIMDIRAVILSVPTSLAISSREHHTFSSAQAYAPSWDSRLCVPSRHSPCGGLLLHWSGSFRTRVHPREPAQDPLTVPSG
jgi:hypothetical protein